MAVRLDSDRHPWSWRTKAQGDRFMALLKSGVIGRGAFGVKVEDPGLATLLTSPDRDRVFGQVAGWRHISSTVVRRAGIRFVSVFGNWRAEGYGAPRKRAEACRRLIRAGRGCLRQGAMFKGIEEVPGSRSADPIVGEPGGAGNRVRPGGATSIVR